VLWVKGSFEVAIKQRKTNRGVKKRLKEKEGASVLGSTLLYSRNSKIPAPSNVGRKPKKNKVD